MTIVYLPAGINFSDNLKLRWICQMKAFSVLVMNIYTIPDLYQSSISLALGDIFAKRLLLFSTNCSAQCSNGMLLFIPAFFYHSLLPFIVYWSSGSSRVQRHPSLCKCRTPAENGMSLYDIIYIYTYYRCC